MMTKNKLFKSLLLGVLLLGILFSYSSIAQADIIPNPVPTNNTPTNSTPANEQGRYVGRGVEASIRRLLCAPSDSSSVPTTNGAVGTTVAKGSSSSQDLSNCINRGYRFALAFGAVAAVFFFVLAGYMYMVGGENGKHEAKNVIISVIVGFLIMLSSFVLLQQINPTLVSFRTIQPPQLGGNYTIASCKELGLGDDCGSPSGDNGPADPNENSPVGDGQEKNGVVYGGGRYRNFPRFAQTDPPWAPKKYGRQSGCSTYYDGGCGPSAFAAIAQYYYQNGGAKISPDIASKYGNQINPFTVGEYAVDKGQRACPGGSYGTLAATVAPAFGLKAQPAGWGTIVTNLEKGVPAWVSMGGLPFTTGGHFIVLIAKKGDEIYIVDSYKRNITRAKASIVQAHFKYGSVVTSPTFTPPVPN